MLSGFEIFRFFVSDHLKDEYLENGFGFLWDMCPLYFQINKIVKDLSMFSFIFI